MTSTEQRRALAGAAPCLLLAAAAGAGEPGDLASAITGGEAAVELRYRYEHVDQEGFAEDAHASTLRLRLDYETGGFRGWHAFGEFDYVFHVLLDDFNSGAGTSPGRTRYPVVADPDGADLNQLYFDYGADDWQLRIGRQRILIDNERFVGNVGWRQNEQTYDALSFRARALPRTDFRYSYVTRVLRIFGDTVDAGRNDADTHLLNAEIAVSDAWSVSPYYYHIDDEDVPAFSTATLGIRATGSLKTGMGRLALAAELATQSDAADAPVDYDAAYAAIDVTWTLESGLAVGFGLESLGGGSPGGAFRTPLATLHKFQGWADQFTSTPDDGVEDLYASLAYPVRGWSLLAVLHDFSAESGSEDWGTEFDFAASRRLAGRYDLLVKGAFFDSDSTAFADTTKFWLMLTAAF